MAVDDLSSLELFVCIRFSIALGDIGKSPPMDVPTRLRL